MSQTGRGVFRWGVAGPGGIASRFADAMTMVPDGEIVAVGSRSLDRADTFADRYFVDRRHGDYESLAADPEVDVVYVATPHSRHEVDAVMFLEAGKHVLCEKPMAVGAAQVERMIRASQDSGCFLMEAIWSRFLPAYRHLSTILAEERIGEPLLVEADLGFRVPVDPMHRLFSPALAGGAALDLGIYPVQLASLVLGRPEEVSAMGELGDTGVDETAAAVLRHPGGRLSVVKASIRIPLACTARITGTDGWIELPAMMHCPESITVRSLSGDDVIEASFDGDGLRFQIPEVHRCIAEGLVESPVVPHAESLALAGTLEAMRDQIGVEPMADGR